MVEIGCREYQKIKTRQKHQDGKQLSFLLIKSIKKTQK